MGRFEQLDIGESQPETKTAFARHNEFLNTCRDDVFKRLTERLMGYGLIVTSCGITATALYSMLYQDQFISAVGLSPLLGFAGKTLLELSSAVEHKRSNNE